MVGFRQSIALGRSRWETSTLTPANEALGLDLGARTVEYDETDAILYALAVGAHATDLELIFERDLHVLPVCCCV